VSLEAGWPHQLPAGPGTDEPQFVLRESAEQRRQREDCHADHERPLAAKSIGQPSSEQQESAEDKGVGVENPLQRLGREAECLLDRRQCDVDDRGVDDDDQLYPGQQCED
jgi:hypothetical protein